MIYKQLKECKHMTDDKIIQNVKDWLKANLKGDIYQIDIEEDNKALLEAIEEWQDEK
tara:strand:- start:277 stop:447 length:171 start_codon:yes stop_codon:yes gene_type:complete